MFLNNNYTDGNTNNCGRKNTGIINAELLIKKAYNFNSNIFNLSSSINNAYKFSTLLPLVSVCVSVCIILYCLTKINK